MIVVVKNDHLEVRDPDDFGRFHVDTAAVTKSEFAALLQLGLGVEAHPDPSHVWVTTDTLRDLLDTENNRNRAEGLDRMLDYASSRGWLNEAGTQVAAHVEAAAH